LIGDNTVPKGWRGSKAIDKEKAWRYEFTFPALILNNGGYMLCGIFKDIANPEDMTGEILTVPDTSNTTSTLCVIGLMMKGDGVKNTLYRYVSTSPSPGYYYLQSIVPEVPLDETAEQKFSIDYDPLAYAMTIRDASGRVLHKATGREGAGIGNYLWPYEQAAAVYPGSAWMYTEITEIMGPLRMFGPGYSGENVVAEDGLQADHVYTITTENGSLDTTYVTPQP
jgi:hypothetical protein